MKNKLFYVITFLAVSLLCPQLVALDKEEQPRKALGLYEAWHVEVAANPLINGVQLLSTNNVPAKLSAIVLEIKQRRFEMAMFLCDKIANEQSISYEDAMLLHETAGIYWFFIEGSPQHTQNIQANLKRMAVSFSEKWQIDKYSNVAGKISIICDQLVDKENNAEISSSDLLAIRRYGIFAIPELVRQIKLNNSKHAFAALLIIIGDRERYAEYLTNIQDQFNSKEGKLLATRENIDNLVKVATPEIELAKKIRASIAD